MFIDLLTTYLHTIGLRYIIKYYLTYLIDESLATARQIFITSKVQATNIMQERVSVFGDFAHRLMASIKYPSSNILW